MLLANAPNVFRQVYCLADYTRKLVESGNTGKAGNCFRIADNLLQNGCATVKLAIENVFMYTIGTLLDQLAAEREMVKQQLTPGLLAIYRKQQQTNGI